MDNYDPSDFGNLPTEPTRDNQIIHAKRLLATQGREALRNPHALIGHECGCGSCFCCAALHVLREHDRNTLPSYASRIATLFPEPRKFGS